LPGTWDALIIRRLGAKDQLREKISALPAGDAGMMTLTQTTDSVQFLDPGELRDGELSLLLSRCARGEACKGLHPSYWFDLRANGFSAGYVTLRLGGSPDLASFEGHLGYAVHPKFRGRHYAERGCRLLLPLARAHEIEPLWITCHPDNAASRRTCQRLGAIFVDIVERSRSGDMLVEGENVRCRYRLKS
jgi:predicted acetyltransferase